MLLLIHRAKHAITIDSGYGFDMLIHIGLESVALAGVGFKVLVTEGQKIKVGDKLTNFDLNTIAEKIVTMITPVLVTDIEEGQLTLEFLAHGDLIKVGQPLLQVKLGENATKSDLLNNSSSIESALIKIPNHHGIHARPAAQLNMIARQYPLCEILLIKGEQSANVKSVVSLLSLSVQYQDQVKFIVRGDNAEQVIQELTNQLTSFNDDESEDFTASDLESENIAKVDHGQYFGVVASTGLAVAKLVHQDIAQFNYVAKNDNVENELDFLNDTLMMLTHDLEESLSSLNHQDGAHKNILNAHLMILTDPDLVDLAHSYIKTGASAAAAWDNATKLSCDKLLATKNKLLIDRQIDFYDVRNRVLTVLCGTENKSTLDYSDDVILIAEDFTPSQIIALSDKVKGLVSIRGGVTSHVSILARTRGIPLLIGVSDAVLQESSNMVILDTLNSAVLHTLASQHELDLAKNAVEQHERALQIAKESSQLSATMLDGTVISCLANIGNQEEAVLAMSNGCDGVGLFRTEFMFLESTAAPTEEEQFTQYSAINRTLEDKNFVVRTLDVGGDKKIPYITQIHEENPMLGVRGIRLCLANRELFKTQLRAILRTKALNIKIMLPMISKLTEFRVAKQILEEIKDELAIETKIKLGIMVEVPSVAFMSEIFAQEVDFMSIGTNDLTQYVMAVDREHTELAKEIDHLHPAVIAAIAATAAGAQKHATELSVCGLMASEKLAIPVLIGLGITNLSMTVSAIPENKAFIRTLDFNKCRDVAEYCLKLATVIEVREYLKSQFN